jgi:hypothetical protein
MKAHLRLFSLGFCLLTLSACTRPTSDGSARFSLTLPAKNQNKVSSKTWGAYLPYFIEDVNCYVVMIEGGESDMRDNVCKSATGTAVMNPGIVVGGFAPGFTTELTVTPGERTIYIVGIQATNTAACATFRSNSNTTDYSAPVIVAQTTRQLVPGDNKVDLTASLSAEDSAIESCTGPDFPEPAAPAVTERPWVVQDGGVVYSSVVHNNKLYLGGAFNYLGPHNGFGTELSATTAARIPTFEDYKYAVWGDVHAAIPDGEGGWYIGGDFATVGIGGPAKVARIRADGSLHSWIAAETPSGIVRALALHNKKLYVGGSFTEIGGVTRNRLFSYDLSTSPSPVTSWNPNLDGEVHDLQFDADGNLYAVGMFTTAGGIAHYGAAKFDSSGNLTAWDPDLDAYAFDVEVSKVHAGRVYLCGGFTSVSGGTPRWLVAAVNNTNGSVVPEFEPSMDIDGGGCSAIAEDSSGNLYVGGVTLTISADPSMLLGPYKLAQDGTVDTSFNPDTNDDVTAMIFYNGKLHVGGNFTMIDSQYRYGLATLNTDGTLASWQSGLAGTPSVLTGQAGRIYVGAESLGSIGGVGRTNFGVIDLTTGRATDLKFDLDDAPIYNLTKAGGNLLIGGSFTWFGDDFRSGFAMIDMATGSLDPNVGLSSIIGDLEVSAAVFALASDGNYVYVGGDSAALDLDPNFGFLFRVDQSDGTLDSGWMPLPDWTVKSLLIDGNDLYAVGDFASFDGPSITGQVIKADKDSLIEDSSFTSPVFNSTLNELFLNNGVLYVTGNFGDVDGNSSAFLTRLNAIDGAVDTGWLSDADGPIEGLTFDGNNLYISGGFNTIGGSNMDGVGRFNLTNSSFANDPTFNLQAPSNIWAFDSHVWNGRLIITGNDGLSAESENGGVQYFTRGVIAATLKGKFFYDYLPPD